MQSKANVSMNVFQVRV